MKKIAFLFLISSQWFWAQDQNKFDLGKNEIKFDVVSLVALGKIHISYERFLSDDFSIGISGNFNESSSLKDDFNRGKSRTLEDYQIIPFVRYSLSKSQIRYYFVEVFVSANQGTYRELKRFTNENNQGYYQSVDQSYSDYAIGAAVGHKFYIKEKIGVDIFVGMGKNLFQNDQSPEIVSRVGLNIGYRF